MNAQTFSGVKLSDEEFKGIMQAVARRINRTANLGHPDAPVGDPSQFQAVPPPQPQGDWQQMFQPNNEDASQVA